MTECKLVSGVYVKDGNNITNTCLGVWSKDVTARQYAEKATKIFKNTHPNLSAVVVHSVELMEFKTN